MYTDIWNAQRFRDMFKDRVLWCEDLGGWFVYNEKVWQRDSASVMKRFCVEWHSDLIRYLTEEFEGDEYQVSQLAKHVKSSGGHSKMVSMLEIAKAFMSKQPEDMDAQGHLFNCQNGTVDLKGQMWHPFDQSGAEVKHKHEHDYLTMISGVNYDPKAKCPMWLNFLDEIFLGNADLIDFIQRVVGYCLTTSTQEQCMFILYGEGRNGKSCFVKTIENMLGDYATTCPQTTLIRKNDGSIPNDVASLKGARFVVASEFNQNVTLDEALIKQMTGSDRITARFLRREFFQFTPTFKIFLMTNHKPNIRGTDFGIWRRVRLIPFEFKVSKEKEDRGLMEKINSELDGIFKWAVEGYKKYASTGLRTPDIVWKATEDYQYEEDDIGQFIEDYYTLDREGSVPCGELTRRFKDTNGYAKSSKVFSEYMRRKGFKQGRKYHNGRQARSWLGIRALKPYEQAADDETTNPDVWE